MIAIGSVPPPVRELRAGLERRYRVEVAQEGGDRFAYRLRMRVDPVSKAKKGDFLLDLKLTDYRAGQGERTIKAKTVGGGTLPVLSTGLPDGLRVSGSQGPLWLPLLSLDLPSPVGEDGRFEDARASVGELTLVAKGEWKPPGLNLDAALLAGSLELGKLTLDTVLDRQGWPERSEGKLVSADGTYRWTLKR